MILGTQHIASVVLAKMLLLDEPYVRPKLQVPYKRDEHETYITPMTPLETGTRIYVFEVAHAHRLTSQRPMVTRRRGPGMIWYSLFWLSAPPMSTVSSDYSVLVFDWLAQPERCQNTARSGSSQTSNGSS